MGWKCTKRVSNYPAMTLKTARFLRYLLPRPKISVSVGDACLRVMDASMPWGHNIYMLTTDWQDDGYAETNENGTHGRTDHIHEEG